MLEVLVRVVAVRDAAPPVRGTVSVSTLRRSSSSGTAVARSSTPQASQCLRDGFGGILLGGVCGFGAHTAILHAT
jgi:hypothetical protein